MDVFGYLLTGATAAAIVKLIDNVVMWWLNRRSKNQDGKNQDAKIEKLNEEAWKKRTEETIENLATGLRVILLDRIRYLGQAYIKENKIDFDDRRLLYQMHEVYQMLGGDGDLGALMKEIRALPLKSGE